MSSTSLFWFREDLRLADNPALHAALAHGKTLCLYVFDEGGDRRPLGGASRWWLSRSLAALADDIAERGGELVIMRGDPATIIPEVASTAGVDLVTWNRRYEAATIALDTGLKQALTTAGIGKPGDAPGRTRIASAESDKPVVKVGSSKPDKAKSGH